MQYARCVRCVGRGINYRAPMKRSDEFKVIGSKCMFMGRTSRDTRELISGICLHTYTYTAHYMHVSYRCGPARVINCIISLKSKPSGQIVVCL